MIKKTFVLRVLTLQKLKTVKYHIFSRKHQFFIIFGKFGSEGKLLKEKKSAETLKTLGLINNMEEYQINI